MEKNRYCVIMAGGIGSRFWPVSRKDKPKQFLDILGTGKSFIRHTYERFAKIIPPENFLVVTHERYKQLVLEHLPELGENQVLGEPVGRNTAPCIAYAAWRLRAMDSSPDAAMVVTPADHLILDEEGFREVIDEGFDFIEPDGLMMTIGIRPDRPDTGYGYIQIEPGCIAGHPQISKVKTFTEKPDLEMAKLFIESGDFYWNSGIFIWKISTILDALQEFLPETHHHFASIASHYNTPAEPEHIAVIYPECRNISIDFGVMERAQNVYVRRSDFGWSDIGTWGSLYQHSPKDDNGNVLGKNCLTYNTHNCIVKSPDDMLVVIEGLDNYIVVESNDVLMICPKEQEQEVKKFIEDVKYRLGEKYI